MKKSLCVFLLLWAYTPTFSQAPQGINYQSVVRDNTGIILPNQNVGLKISIRQGSATGAVIFSEAHNLNTNQFGLVNLVIGQGSVLSGTFNSINWSTGNYFSELSLDVAGGTNYISMGTQQLMSVPYALYAETSGSGSSGGGTLDDAYNFGAPGAGRIITANNGPVEINTSVNNTSGLAVSMTGIGNCINVLASNTSNQFAAIQAQTTSTVSNNSAVFGNATGAGTTAKGVSGQIDANSSTDDAILGTNLRTNGGIGVEGVGFNGLSGQTNYRQGYAVYGENFDLIGPLSANAVGVAGIGYVGVAGQSDDPVNGFGLYSFDNIGAQGVKNFIIDHPLDPANKYLKHFSVESNEVLNMYRGNTICDNNGESEITLPDYFNKINIQFSYHLTPIGDFASLFVKEKVNGNKFSIAGGKPAMEVSWMIVAERNDAYLQEYSPAKNSEVEKRADDKGKYLLPSAVGKSKEEAIFKMGMKR